MSKYMSRYTIDDLVENDYNRVLQVVDILHVDAETIYECSDGNLYHEWELHD